MSKKTKVETALKEEKAAVKTDDKILNRYATELKDLFDAKDKYEAMKKETQSAIDELNTKFVALMETMGITSFKVEEIGTIFLREDMYPKIEDAEKLFSDLKQNGMGTLIKETVNLQTLRGYCNELLKDGKSVPAGVKETYKTSVRINK